MLLGCIGDDFTGSSDLGLTLVKEGMRVTQYCGVPNQSADSRVDAGIVALKSRTSPVGDAVRESIAALKWLQDQGCRQFLFKYCSTFDSTREGNIGPVLDALVSALDTDRAIVCPAFPATGRTVYQGHLFVGDRLLNESGMQHHPLTPMTDSDIRRWLSHQTERSVGHVPHSTVCEGPAAIRQSMNDAVSVGRPLIVIDAVSEVDLRMIGEACRDTVLVSGGSGIGIGLPANFGFEGSEDAISANWVGKSGNGVVLAGSCSNATREQIARFAASHPARSFDAADVMSRKDPSEELAGWLLEQREREPILYSSADPGVVELAQHQYGRDAIANAVEALFSKIAQRLFDAGIKRIVVAGGETSGAVAEGLDLQSLNIGPEIAPGVPALDAGDRDLAIAFKSGNFGGPDFFEHALSVLGAKHVP